MSLDGNVLLASMFVGGIGFVFFAYGKKQSRLPQMLVGVALMGFPYFVSSVPWMFGIAAGLIGLVTLALRAGL